MLVESNFCAWLSEGGRIVPGSERRGHNVITDAGREWLSQISVWDSFSPDVPVDERRFRWIGVGGGYQSEILSVVALVSPLTLTTGPDEYIRVLGTKSAPVQTSVKFTTVFTGASADLDHHGATVDVSEAGIFVDIHDGAGTLLDPTVGTNVPAAYKAFTALTKAQAQDLTITWEFRF